MSLNANESPISGSHDVESVSIPPEPSSGELAMHHGGGVEVSENASDDRLASLIDRIHNLTASGSATSRSGEGSRVVPAASQPEPQPQPQPEPEPEPVESPQAEEPETDWEPSHDEPFVPAEPSSFEQAGLTPGFVEELLLKYLLTCGEASGRDAAGQVKLPFVLIDELLQRMKRDQLVYFRGSSEVNDYIYQLTEMGRERARRLTEHCMYSGAAPVPLADYIESVKAQSIETQHPDQQALEHAFRDLLINPKMLSRLGPAINSGRGMFLYGYPGNGKTSIAERVTTAFGSYVWIPRSLLVDGEIMRLYDPMNHVAVAPPSSRGLLDQSRIDKRWVRIKRPTIVVGGELTMANLEVMFNQMTGISEAPLQLKSNCGTLVIDDFGRQKISTDQLLNRWIVPLEKRYDFLNMSNGKKIQVPFDQLIIFSTNLEPKDLVDDAFLRRIPYKIEVQDPTEEEFRKLFEIMCPIVGIEYEQGPIDHLIETHYRRTGRPFRCCQPRDLLLQIRNHCSYQNVEPELTNEHFDFAAENYFAVL